MCLLGFHNLQRKYKPTIWTGSENLTLYRCKNCKKIKSIRDGITSVIG